MALYLGPFLGIISVHCLAIARATGPVKEISKTQQKPVAGVIRRRGKKKKEIKKSVSFWEKVLVPLKSTSKLPVSLIRA